MNIADLEAENATLKAALTEANAILKNPDSWMRWCDNKVLERAETAERNENAAMVKIDALEAEIHALKEK